MKRLIFFAVIVIAVASFAYGQHQALYDSKGKLIGRALAASSDGVDVLTPAGFVVPLRWDGMLKQTDTDRYVFGITSEDNTGTIFALVHNGMKRPDASEVLNYYGAIYVFSGKNADGTAMADENIKRYRQIVIYIDSDKTDILGEMPKNYSAYPVKQAEYSTIGLPIPQFPGAGVNSPMTIRF